MNNVMIRATWLLGLALTCSPVMAAPSNLGPPAGALFQLAGRPINTTYQMFGFSFVATTVSTDLTFAFRHDPGFIRLDDVSVTAGGGSNLVVNGGFEDGPINSGAPQGWTYANIFGSLAGGQVLDNLPRTGSLYYRSGSIQAYDAITQNISTVIGTTYDVSFWALSSEGAGDFYRALSTNGNVTDAGGNARNLAVYAQNGLPSANPIPEPATWAMMVAGMGAIGGGLRRRRYRAAQFAI